MILTSIETFAQGSTRAFVVAPPEPTNWPELLKAEPRMKGLAKRVAAGDFGNDERSWSRIKAALDLLIGHKAAPAHLSSSTVHDIATCQLQRIINQRRRWRGAK